MSKPKPTRLAKLLERLAKKDTACKFRELPHGHQAAFRAICDKIGLKAPTGRDWLAQCARCRDDVLLIRIESGIGYCLRCHEAHTAAESLEMLKHPRQGPPERKMVESFDLLATFEDPPAPELTRKLVGRGVFDQSLGEPNR